MENAHLEQKMYLPTFGYKEGIFWVLDFGLVWMIGVKF
jgi:hypothetical protein